MDKNSLDLEILGRKLWGLSSFRRLRSHPRLRLVDIGDRLLGRGGSGRKWRFRKLQKKAPNALKSLDARLKSALRVPPLETARRCEQSEAGQTKPRLETLVWIASLCSR